MRRHLRCAVAAVLTAAFVAAVPSPAHAVPAAAVLVIPAQSPVQYTPFATVPGVAYLITVTGSYNPNRVTPNHDCGWSFTTTNDPGVRHGMVTVDGHAAGCQSLDYSPTHAYQWTEFGTGAPFRLSIADPQGLLAGSGGLTFVITGPRAEVPHDVTSFCFPHAAATPALDYVPVVVEAGAQAASTGAVAMAVFVACDVTSSSGESVHLRQGLPGPLVETSGRMTVPPGDLLTVCSYAGATWDDSVVVETSRVCYTARAE